ncbi:MAG: sugar phosphate isomerase/epimerase [Clostridiaceae bacterium]|jgi:sugar phosphate isomerase/epimerase|nr:sugar phosphate isomerase/epimerase [Clostridiaceae bacterium]
MSLSTSFPIALQLYSVRDELEKDFVGTLKKTKELGYDGVEFAGLYGHEPAQVKDILSQIGLVPLSAHVPFLDLIADPDKVVGEYAEIGCKYIVIPYLLPEYRPGEEKFQEVISGAQIIGEAAKKAGLTLLYHNHDFEFKKIGGIYALDILYNKVPSDLLKTQIDTCWVGVAGEDPAEYVRKYSGRAPVVHLKDYVMPGKNPQKMYDLIGIEDEKKDYKAGDAFGYRPIGLGVQNFSEILKACKDAGTLWVVIEQDEPSMGKTSFECAEISIKQLKSL